MQRLPPWIRIRIPADGQYDVVHRALESGGLNTVCRSAHCPNEHECFNRGTATFMILGRVCTRNCSFCAVETGRPGAPDPGEPGRLAAAARSLGLTHVVVTSVTRDDLPDGGAAHFARTIESLRREVPLASVEVLTPDFRGDRCCVETVLAAGPDVFNHNVETVRRLQKRIRPSADYDRSLAVLAMAAAWRPAVRVKSGLMVGLGETDAEIDETMADLRAAGCGLLTIGQYLAPSSGHAPVARFVDPERFAHFGRRALELGFSAVASAPLVRSSYRAERMVGAAGKEEAGSATDLRRSL